MKKTIGNFPLNVKPNIFGVLMLRQFEFQKYNTILRNFFLRFATTGLLQNFIPTM